MKTSKCFLIISKNSRTIRAWEGKFERQIGEKMNMNGMDYFVFSLFDSLHSAAGFLGCYGANDAYIIAKRELGDKIASLNIR